MTDPSELDRLEAALRASWGADTCVPEDRASWSQRNPARGQCITTVLVVHDLVGGELVRGDVHVDGQQVDFHWWNRLPDSTEVDLTREQFGPDEVVSGSTTFVRPADGGRVAGEYAVLRARVDALLRST